MRLLAASSLKGAWNKRVQCVRRAAFQNFKMNLKMNLNIDFMIYVKTSGDMHRCQHARHLRYI